MVTKTQVMELIDYEQAEISRFAEGICPGSACAPSAPNDWSDKDIIAHLGEWTRRQAMRMSAARRGDTLPIEEDFDAINAAIYITYRDRAWEEVLALTADAIAQLREQVAAFTEENLNAPIGYSWTNGRALWRSIQIDTLVHPTAHLGEAYLRRDQYVEAVRLWEQEAKLSAALDDTATWRGRALYNLACHYAQAGERETALHTLAQAFALDPNLAQWSQQDRDLAALSGDPEFLALAEHSVQARSD